MKLKLQNFLIMERNKHNQGNDRSSIRIFNYKDTYRLKFSYDSNLNLEKFI